VSTLFLSFFLRGGAVNSCELFRQGGMRNSRAGVTKPFVLSIPNSCSLGGGGSLYVGSLRP
jgi:hypothetical protein